MCKPKRGSGTEAQRLRKVNIRTKELEQYELQIASLIGKRELTKADLTLMLEPARRAGAGEIGRTDRRGKWSLMAHVKKAFPKPEDFVQRAIEERLPFVAHLPRRSPDKHDGDRDAQGCDPVAPVVPFTRILRGPETWAHAVPDVVQCAPVPMMFRVPETDAHAVRAELQDVVHGAPDQMMFWDDETWAHAVRAKLQDVVHGAPDQVMFRDFETLAHAVRAELQDAVQGSPLSNTPQGPETDAHAVPAEVPDVVHSAPDQGHEDSPFSSDSNLFENSQFEIPLEELLEMGYFE